MVQKYTLDNGIRVICDQEDYFKTFSLGFWVKAGSIYENEGNNGYTHLLEHMLFKGTHKRNYLDISQEIDSAGGHINAFTERENTCFYVHLMSHHQDLGVDILWDMIANSTIHEEELDKEKMVVIEEIKMYEDSPEELIHDLFFSHIWKSQALGYPILGTIPNIQNANRQKVFDFYQEFYSPENLIISIAGDLDSKRLLGQLEKLKFPHDGLNQHKTSPSQLNFENHCQIKDLEQVYFVLGFNAFSRYDPRRFALYLLSNIIGGGSSSRLFLEVREKQGLAYSIYSFAGLYQDSGVFGISSSTSLENYPPVLKIIIREIKKLCREGVSEEELRRSKEQLKGGVIFGMENLESRMSRNAKQELDHERFISPEEIVGEIEKVRLDDVNDLIREVLTLDSYSFYSLGEEEHSRISLSNDIISL